MQEPERQENIMHLAAKDLEDLNLAVAILEHLDLVTRLTSALGLPIEKTLAILPETIYASIHEASHAAIQKALDLTILTLGERPSEHSSNRTHQFLCGMSGAFGGFWGAPGMAVELPLSTLIMLRSIGDIARSEGEDLTVPQTKLACLEVFALGSSGKTEEGIETGYYAVRAALAKFVWEAARFLSKRHFIEEGGPILAKLVTKIAARFSISVSHKFAVQALPVLALLAARRLMYYL